MKCDLIIGILHGLFFEKGVPKRGVKWDYVANNSPFVALGGVEYYPPSPSLL